MKRKIYDQLISWKRDSAEQTAVPYVLHIGDLREEEGIVYLPHYMTPLL